MKYNAFHTSYFIPHTLKRFAETEIKTILSLPQSRIFIESDKRLLLFYKTLSQNLLLCFQNNKINARR